MMAFKTNAAKIALLIKEKADATLAAMQLGLREGVQDFEAHIIKDQMTGRPGLKSQSGNLRNSWLIEDEGQKENYVVRLGLMRKGWYGKVHEHLDFSGTIRAKNPSGYLKFRIGKKFVMTRSVYIPPRLFVRRDWQNDGMKYLQKRVYARLLQETKNRI